MMCGRSGWNILFVETPNAASPRIAGQLVNWRMCQSFSHMLKKPSL